MRVGLTYDLRSDYLAAGFGVEETAEFDEAETIDGLDAALSRRGFAVDRIGNVRALAERLVRGDRWDFVFNIAEGLRGVGREAQVPALLEAFGVPYTGADPLVAALCLDKALTKRVVRDAGLATAPFAVVSSPADLAGPALDGLRPPLFAKPVAEGSSKGITGRSRVDDPATLRRVCADLLARYAQPVLVETYLPGREFTVGIVGTGPDARIVGVMEIELLAEAEAGVYSYDNKNEWEGRIRYALATDAEARAAGATALACWTVLGCRDGGRVDMRSDTACVPNFIEVNPLAGLNPAKSDLVILARLAGWSYNRLIDAIVESCLARNGLAAGRDGGVRPRRAG